MTESDRRAIMKGIEDCRPKRPDHFAHIDSDWSCVMIPPEAIRLHSVMEHYSIELGPFISSFAQLFAEELQKPWHRGGTAIRFKEFNASADRSSDRQSAWINIRNCGVIPCKPIDLTLKCIATHFDTTPQFKLVPRPATRFYAVLLALLTLDR